MASKKLHGPLRIDEDAIGKLSSGHLQHSTRLFDIEMSLTEIGADVKHIRAHMAKQSRINDALMEIRVNDAKNVIAQADLLNE